MIELVFFDGVRGELKIMITIDAVKNHIQDYYVEDTGGGILCDVLVLDDDTVLVISSEAIVLYPDISAWLNNPRRQIGSIYRPESQ